MGILGNGPKYGPGMCDMMLDTSQYVLGLPLGRRAHREGADDFTEPGSTHSGLSFSGSSGATDHLLFLSQ